jgi:hypothetical protein
MDIHKFIRRHDFVSGKPINIFSSSTMIEVTPRIIFDFVPNTIQPRYSTTMSEYNRYYTTIRYNNHMPMVNGTVIFS